MDYPSATDRLGEHTSTIKTLRRVSHIHRGLSSDPIVPFVLRFDSAYVKLVISKLRSAKKHGNLLVPVHDHILADPARSWVRRNSLEAKSSLMRLDHCI